MRHIRLYEDYKRVQSEKEPLLDLYRVRINVNGERPHPREEDKTVISTFKAIGIGETENDAATYALAGLHLRLEGMMGYGHDGNYWEILNLQDANSLLDNALYKYKRSKEETVNDLSRGKIDPNHLNDLFDQTECTAEINRVQMEARYIGGEYTDERAWIKGEEAPESTSVEKQIKSENQINPEKQIKPKKPPMSGIKKALSSGNWEEIKRINKLRYR